MQRISFFVFRFSILGFLFFSLTYVQYLRISRGGDLTVNLPLLLFLKRFPIPCSAFVYLRFSISLYFVAYVFCSCPLLQLQFQFYFTRNLSAQYVCVCVCVYLCGWVAKKRGKIGKIGEMGCKLKQKK